MPNDRQYMYRCMQLARLGAYYTAPNPMVGAVLVRYSDSGEEEVIAEGWHQQFGGPHAEVNCIRQACKKLGTFILEGCEIYSSTEPCPMCLSAIYWAHIDKIYYAATKDDAAYGGFDDDFIYKELDTEKTKRKIPALNFLQEEGRKVFDIWLKTENKTEY